MTRPRADDTIIALASGAGRAGVAVLRISGPGAAGLLALLGGLPVPEPRKAAIRALRADGSYLDEALVLYMPGPNSFTGEDVVELHVHGGPAVIEAVIGAALKSRMCRLAEPGEFTRRAFEAGRIDLTQAEAVADLVDAETEGQRRQAARIYQGEAAEAFESWRGQLISAMAALEAAIDFPDESDIPREIDISALAPIESLAAALEATLGEATRFRLVREGFRVAILGAPNAGKSSLMNRLARQEAAIVSPIPGTTRDVVEVRLVIAGFPVWVADTAGLRETGDAIEAEGVRRALARAGHADLRIWVIDASGGTPALDVSRETHWRPGDLVALNKADLSDQRMSGGADGDTFAISVLTGAGVDALEKRLAEVVRERLSSDEAPLITRARHRELVEAALAHVERALEGARIGVGAELVSEDLRMAARSLGRITGTVDVEDLLDRIFSSFCIGK
ncbi:MAG: tRNA uridine-5-carboxymethylaminomethyl(34) synthesis GTPase MnmE [Alphaproteobacteria bacterium]|nr:tRNA uridine-5-carboxymethylaminomethyl(34) synthesis GTPase MnmE [Alphaproteobacteria bacterium]